MRTIKDHARNVKCLMSYVPCNLSGVIFSFAEWMQLACDIGMNQSERKSHPITRGYLIALHSMGIPNSDSEYSETLSEIDVLIESKEVEGI